MINMQEGAEEEGGRGVKREPFLWASLPLLGPCHLCFLVLGARPFFEFGAFIRRRVRVMGGMILYLSFTLLTLFNVEAEEERLHLDRLLFNDLL